MDVREIFGLDKPVEPDDEFDKMIQELIDELHEVAEQMKIEVEELSAKLVAGTYWKYVSEGQTVYFHVVSRDGVDALVRAVRLADLPYGRRYSLEPEANISLTTFADVTEAAREEYAEALNEAFLAAQKMCDLERYHKEEA
jgi:hypothetical protein